MKRKKKRICVIGLGQFGRELAVSFAPQCEVMAIDINETIVNQIANRVDSAVVVDACDFASLAAVVSPDFDEAIVGLSENMEASILAVLHLKKIGIARVHAKARNRDHATILDAIGVDAIIFPERDTARRLVRQVMNPNLLDHLPIGEDYAVMQITAPDAFVGKSLQALDLRHLYGIFVIAMKSHKTGDTSFLPGPDAIVERFGLLTVIGKPQDVEQMQLKIGE
ncbi:MAG: potassium channel family protein [Kiritimatiellia bacterium]